MPNASDSVMFSHEQLAELLLDYATGTLPENNLQLVEEHLAGCEACRQELSDLLETTSLIVNAGSPRAEVRQLVMHRLKSVGGRKAGFASPKTPILSHTRRTSIPPRLHRPAWALATIFLVATVVLGSWTYLLQQKLDDQDRIAGLITGEATAHVLTDSDLDSGASGVIFVNPVSDQALLVASGLEPLPSDYRYQIWLFTENGQHVSAGFLPVVEAGLGQALVGAPAPLGEYVAVALSAEPAHGSDAPTAPLSLGGWID